MGTLSLSSATSLCDSRVRAEEEENQISRDWHLIACGQVEMPSQPHAYLHQQPHHDTAELTNVRPTRVMAHDVAAVWPRGATFAKSPGSPKSSPRHLLLEAISGFSRSGMLVGEPWEPAVMKPNTRGPPHPGHSGDHGSNNIRHFDRGADNPTIESMIAVDPSHQDLGGTSSTAEDERRKRAMRKRAAFLRQMREEDEARRLEAQSGGNSNHALV